MPQRGGSGNSRRVRVTALAAAIEAGHGDLATLTMDCPFCSQPMQPEAVAGPSSLITREVDGVTLHSHRTAAIVHLIPWNVCHSMSADVVTYGCGPCNASHGDDTTIDRSTLPVWAYGPDCKPSADTMRAVDVRYRLLTTG